MPLIIRPPHCRHHLKSPPPHQQRSQAAQTRHSDGRPYPTHHNALHHCPSSVSRCASLRLSPHTAKGHPVRMGRHIVSVRRSRRTRRGRACVYFWKQESCRRVGCRDAKSRCEHRTTFLVGIAVRALTSHRTFLQQPRRSSDQARRILRSRCRSVSVSVL